MCAFSIYIHICTHIKYIIIRIGYYTILKRKVRENSRFNYVELKGNLTMLHDI